jgi:mono/diheme cytochrome c family protein
MRRTALLRVAVTAALVATGLAGCRQDMHNQPKYKAFRENVFYADLRSARPLVDGVVARGHLDEDPAFFKGAGPNGPLAANPLGTGSAVLARGQERFNIYCSPCHDRTGSGAGMIVQRGYKQPPSFDDDRLRNMPDGYFFQVMTDGFATMPAYRAQVPPRDRWAIVAYIRALQLSQHATLADVPAADQAALGAAQ